MSSNHARRGKRKTHEIQIDGELKNRLKAFPVRESVYTIYRDGSQGVIIY